MRWNDLYLLWIILQAYFLLLASTFHVDITSAYLISLCELEDCEKTPETTVVQRHHCVFFIRLVLPERGLTYDTSHESCMGLLVYMRTGAHRL